MTKTLLALVATLACGAAAATQPNSDATTAPVVKRATPQRSATVAVRKRPTTISYVSPRARTDPANSPWSTPMFQQARALR